MYNSPVSQRLRNATLALADTLQGEGVKYEDAKILFMKAWFERALARNGNNRCSVAASEHLHRNTVARYMKASGVVVSGRIKQSGGTKWVTTI